MKYSFCLILSFFIVAGCGKSGGSRNPPEIVSRDSDTVFNDIPGAHHLGEESFNMNIVDLLENVRKTHAFLEFLEKEGLRDTLKTEGPFTVFALSDTTINQSDPAASRGSIASDTGNELSGESIRQYIIQGKVTKADLAERSVTAKDLAGNEVTIRLENDNLVINDKAYNSSEAFVAKNGVVYELNRHLE